MANWCIAECLDVPTPAVLVGCTSRALIDSRFGENPWRFETQLRGGSSVGVVVDWPVVKLYEGTLRSERDPGPYTNLLYVCGEWLSFKKAELVDVQTWALDGLQRALRGTSSWDHFPGEEVMLLDNFVDIVPIRPLEVGLTLTWRCRTDDDRESDELRNFTHSGAKMPSLTGKCASSRPTKQWGARYVDGPLLYTWLDKWIAQSVEPGTTLLLDGRMVYWDGEGYKTL